MNNENANKIVKAKIEVAKIKLVMNLESLKSTLEKELKRIDEDSNYVPNNLGIIQSQALEIDLLCSRLGALSEMKELIKED